MLLTLMVTLLSPAHAARISPSLLIEQLFYDDPIVDFCLGDACEPEPPAPEPGCDTLDLGGSFGIDHIETCGDCSTTFFNDGSSVETCNNQDCPSECHLGTCIVTTYDDGLVLSQCQEDQGGYDSCGCEESYMDCAQAASDARDYCYSNAGEGDIDAQAAYCDRLYGADLQSCDAEELSCDSILYCE